MNSILTKYFTYKRVSNLTKSEFIVLNTLSFGAYSVYWAWAAWETVRLNDKRDYKIKSSLRAIILPVSSFWLFPKIATISKYNFLPYTLAVAFLLFTVITFWIPVDMQHHLKGLVTYVAVGLIDAVLLLPVFEAQRRASNKVKVSGDNKPLILVLAALCVIVIAGLFISPA